MPLAAAYWPTGLRASPQHGVFDHELANDEVELLELRDLGHPPLGDKRDVVGMRVVELVLHLARELH